MQFQEIKLEKMLKIKLKTMPIVKLEKMLKSEAENAKARFFAPCLRLLFQRRLLFAVPGGYSKD